MTTKRSEVGAVDPPVTRPGRLPKDRLPRRPETALPVRPGRVSAENPFPGLRMDDQGLVTRAVTRCPKQAQFCADLQIPADGFEVGVTKDGGAFAIGTGIGRLGGLRKGRLCVLHQFWNPGESVHVRAVIPVQVAEKNGLNILGAQPPRPQLGQDPGPRRLKGAGSVPTGYRSAGHARIKEKMTAPIGDEKRYRGHCGNGLRPRPRVFARPGSQSTCVERNDEVPHCLPRVTAGRIPRRAYGSQ